MGRAIYLDHSATTAMHPSVLETMIPFMVEKFGNASSAHFFGEEAKTAMDASRQKVADILVCQPSEVIFTSGGTESDNLLLKGVGFALKKMGLGNHIVTSVIEHHAIGNTCEWLVDQGFEVTTLPVNLSGIVDPEAVVAALRPKTIIVSVMYANNEVGTIQPIAEISHRVKAFNSQIVMHTDAVQTPGHLLLDTTALGVDALSLSAHKFYGPKGTGLLFLRQGIPLEPRILGGAHELNRRAGTENVPGMVGLATALARVEAMRTEESARLTNLRDTLIERALSEISDCQLNGDRQNRLVTNANFSFAGVEGDAILLALSQDGIAVSTGSACNTGQSSFVLKAMGVDERLINGSIRLTLGEENSLENVETVIEKLKQTVARLRAMAG